jgi:hypothetical protein
MACTQFEATDARRALPCWDEPAIKSTFSVIIQAPQHMQALSNMPALRSSPVSVGGASFVRHEFDRTPIMSTYLLAFVVGEFDSVETKTKRGTTVRCFTPPGKGKLGEFALDVGRRALELYEEYFEIPYPLPKLDQVAIPDFSAGAMEVRARAHSLLHARSLCSAHRSDVCVDIALIFGFFFLCVCVELGFGDVSRVGSARRPPQLERQHAAMGGARRVP